MLLLLIIVDMAKVIENHLNKHFSMMHSFSMIRSYLIELSYQIEQFSLVEVSEQALQPILQVREKSGN